MYVISDKMSIKTKAETPKILKHYKRMKA